MMYRAEDLPFFFLNYIFNIFKTKKKSKITSTKIKSVTETMQVLSWSNQEFQSNIEKKNQKKIKKKSKKEKSKK